MIWHPVTTTLHMYLSWKTDKLLWLPIRKRIRYKVACMCVLVLLTSLNCYMSTLRLVHYAIFLTHAYKRKHTNARLIAFALSLALDPTFGKHDGNEEEGWRETTLAQVILITILRR